MYPIDALTSDDKAQMVNWIESTQKFKPQTSIDNILRFWNQNKIRLFKMFGNQLRIEVPISSNATASLLCLNKQMEKGLGEQRILSTYSGYDSSYSESDTSYFPNNLSQFIYDNYYCNNSQFSVVVVFNRLLNYGIRLSYDTAMSGKLMYSENFTVGENKYSLPKGMKYTKAVKTFCKAVGFELDKTFEEWRNRYSDFRTRCTNPEKMKMVFSIHPFDYMTMSDGGDWSTCMSWKNNGCYSASTLEMMGSNNVVVCYAVPAKDTSDFKKKVWRSLVVVDKDIIVTGKSYPFHNDELSKFILNYITKMAHDKFNWNYQYKNQRYKDLSRYEGQGEDSLRRPSGREGYGGNRIVIYTNGFYNDWFQDLDEKYWCNRNYVSKTKGICVSGPAPCLLCGEKIDKQKPSTLAAMEFSTAANAKLCDDCYDRYMCGECYKVSEKLINILVLQYCEKTIGFCPEIETGIFTYDDTNACVKCATEYLHRKEYQGRMVIIYENDEKIGKIFLDRDEAIDYTIDNQENISRIILFYRAGYSAEKNYELYQKEGKDCLNQYLSRLV